MKLKFKFIEDWMTIVFIMLLLLSSISAIKYFDSEDVFNTQISSVNTDNKYSIDLELETLVSEPLDYEIEILYKRANLVVDSQTISCKTKCLEKIEIKKIFFDKYNVFVRTFHQGRGYEKKLTFNFEEKKLKFETSIPNQIIWESGNLEIPLKIEKSQFENTQIIVDIFPTKKTELKNTFKFNCGGKCDKTFTINQNILFGEYTANIYSQTDSSQIKFVVLPKNISQSQIDALTPKLPNTPKQNNSQNQTNKIIQTPITENSTIKQKVSDLEESIDELKITKTIVNTSSAKLVRNYSKINDELEKQIKEELNLNSNSNLELDDILNETKSENKENKIIAIDLSGNEIELNNISELLENKKYTAVLTTQENTNRNEKTENKRPQQIQLKPIIQNVNTLTEIENLTLREISVTEKLQKKDSSAFNFKPSNFGTQSIDQVSKQIIGKEEKILEQTDRGFEKTDLTLEKLAQTETNKLVPGIYKKEQRTLFADGSEEIKEEYFAYGLITVNTKKPLYKKNELVEFLIVVLDANGYLVKNADIKLEVTKPNNQSVLLTTKDKQIQPTDKDGVYSSLIYASELGNYNLYAQVEQYNMIVDVETYFNVVEDNKIPFQILRDVPVTIDPWLGPFNNTFKIKPETYTGTYNFTEVFSSDFTNISTNADLIETKQDLIYLTWNNLTGTNNDLFYSAQVPLVTPYLYELGKSFVDYSSENFYENRPWLFAIDPVAKTCGFTSPCECGTPCAGGPSESAAGDGTIDSCADTNVQYEWVNEVTVTNTDGSDYFGTGNNVTVCISVRVDRNERVNLFYMDHSANSGTTFGATTPVAGVTTIYESYGLHSDDGDHTYCTTTLLNNYVGKHYIRGKQVYQGTAGRTCQGSGGYKDQDDIVFDVLSKVAPVWQSWTLDNGTTTGNNLNVIRGNNITFSSNWDRPLQAGQVRHNGDGTNKWFDVTTFDNNQTTYIHQTSNISEFPNVGIVNTNQVTADEYYFSNQTLYTTGNRRFDIYGITKINQTVLSPYIIFESNSSTMSCQVTDENVGVPYQNKIVEFFKDGSSLGTNTTDVNGWTSMSFTTPLEGDYDINCVIYDELAKYYLASKTNYNETKLLTVKPAGADINPPIISNIKNLTTTTFGVGAPFKVKANFTDDISLKELFVNFTNPSGTSIIEKHSAFDNLISHWNFDKKNSSHIHDVNLNNFHGSFENGATIGTVNGIRNSYGVFDGSDDYLNIPYNSKLNPDSFSFGLWVKVTGGVGTTRVIISSRGMLQEGYIISAGSSNNWEFEIGDGSVWKTISGSAISLNTWTHLAGTYNGTSMILYENGVQVGVPLLATLSKNILNEFRIGSGQPFNEFGGNIDDIWLFNRTLTSWEIQNLYTHNSILNTSYEFEYGGTSEDGVYPYYFGACDISDNPTLSSTLNFNAIGVRTFLGAQTTKSLYKVGQSVAMTSAVYTNDFNNSIITDIGDTGNIFYDFTSDLQGWSTGTLNAGTIDWVRGNDADCPNQPCIATNLNAAYNINTNQFIESPVHDFSGRSLVKISYYRMMNVENGVSGDTDRTFLEAYDGTDWDLKVYQDSLGGSSLGAGTSLYSASDLNGLSNTKFRFRLTSNANANSNEGWKVDDINISFNPREEWDNDWHNYDTTFGTSGNRTTALKFEVNITSYDNTGSITNTNNNPDLEIQVFNGTDYEYSHTCSLTSGLTYPHTCSFLIKKNPKYLTAWETNTNRNIRIRAINMDKDDSITWSNVKREYVTPSVIENHGAIPISNLLLQQIKNSAGQVVATIHNNITNIAPGANLDLSSLGTFTVPFIPFGNYTFYSALTDLDGNVLENGDDGSPVNDTYPFQIFSLTYQDVNPLQSELYSTNVLGNFTLDETYFSWGGTCEYSLDNQANTTMPNIAGTYFEKTFLALGPGQHTIQYFCNDTDGDTIASELITFDVGVQLSQDARVKKRVSYINNTNLIRNFLVQLSFENLEGKTLNKTLFDYVEPSFTTSNFSLLPTSNKSFGNNFPGMMNWWNISLTSHEIKNISYIISTNSTTTIDKTFIVGFQ